MPDPITPPSDGVWHYEYITPRLLQAERVDRVIYSGKTNFQSVTIHDTSCFGRSLVLDNKTQSTELDVDHLMQTLFACLFLAVFSLRNYKSISIDMKTVAVKMVF